MVWPGLFQHLQRKGSGAHGVFERAHRVILGQGRITGASVWDGNARVYSPANKPTAADVGALTDAQAAQKYALRSIRVNGKPLTGDVNLLASDVNAWNKTEADGRFVKQAGDTMIGPLTVPRIVFPDGATGNADSDVNRPNGFTVESLAEVTHKGYPVPGGMGVLFTGKANEFRNVQFWWGRVTALSTCDPCGKIALALLSGRGCTPRTTNRQLAM